MTTESKSNSYAEQWYRREELRGPVLLRGQAIPISPIFALRVTTKLYYLLYYRVHHT